MSSTTQPAADWHRGRVASWLVSVDHKRIGALYLGWAGVFFVIAGVLTLLMRLQMTRPDASILGSGTYRGVLTMHGTLLVFFVLLPVVTGLATYIVPLMIGARTIAMPGSAAVALWLFVFGGAAVTLSAFAGGGASQAGWTGLPATRALPAGQRRRSLADGVAAPRDLAPSLGDEPDRDDPHAPHGRHGVVEHADVRLGRLRLVVAVDRARADRRARAAVHPPRALVLRVVRLHPRR